VILNESPTLCSIWVDLIYVWRCRVTNSVLDCTMMRDTQLVPNSVFDMCGSNICVELSSHELCVRSADDINRVPNSVFDMCSSIICVELSSHELCVRLHNDARYSTYPQLCVRSHTSLLQNIVSFIGLFCKRDV